MLTNISWSQYLITVVVVITLYYLLVIFRYFRDDITRKLSGGVSLAQQQNPSIKFPGDHGTDGEVKENDRRDVFAAVEELIGKVKSLVSKIDHSDFDRQSFIECLQAILIEYPDLKNSEVKSSVSELISSEVEKNGTVILSEQDVDKLW